MKNKHGIKLKEVILRLVNFHSQGNKLFMAYKGAVGLIPIRIAV